MNPAGQTSSPPAPPPSDNTAWWVVGLILGGLAVWEYAKWKLVGDVQPRYR